MYFCLYFGNLGVNVLLTIIAFEMCKGAGALRLLAGIEPRNPSWGDNWGENSSSSSHMWGQRNSGCLNTVMEFANEQNDG